VTVDGLHFRFLRGLAEEPDNAAVVVGSASVTYREAHRIALSWAGALLAAAPHQKAVGVLAGRSVEAYLGILAALYAGVPVVPLLAEFPTARTAHMLAAAEVSVLMVDDHGAARVPELGLDLPVLALGQGAPDPGHALRAPRPVAPSDIAYVLFTSGSTGRPKGVRLTHGSLGHYFGLMDSWYDFTAADVFSQVANLNWDMAISDLWCAWGAGATLVAVPGQAYRNLPRFVRDHRISVWFSAPSAIALARRTGGLTPGSMPTLRWVYIGGEALKYADADDWQLAAPNATLLNVYGPTEMTITTHRHRWSPRLSPALGVNGVVPLGTLHDGHEELLLDESGQQDDEGELWLTGPQMSAGYLDPGDAHGKYLHRDGRTWYRTGDRVRRVAGGELVYLGRIDAQVQVQGMRVELAEIEHALRTCEGVEDAVTVAAEAGRGTELVVFYTGKPVTPTDFARSLGKILPAQMVPRHYRQLPEFPLNTNKKVDRRRLTHDAETLFGKAA
jgi:amino acid adenylation domain-containing protein